MKKLITCAAIALCATTSMAPAEAHGWRGGGWGYPLAAGMIVGAGIYAASNPYYYPAYGYPTQVVYQAQPTVVYQQAPAVTAAPPAPRTAYYCQTTKQFYPTVPTCKVTWEQVTVY
jgi:hypothetical protein